MTVIKGVRDNNKSRALNSTPEGHLEVAVHDPLLPFGSVHAESLTPIFQTDAVYGINDNQILATTSLSGGATASNGLFEISTGATVAAQASIQSRKRLRYRPGQGVIMRFTALFTTPVASSYQVAGLGHAEDGVFVGYKGTDFGIVYNVRGVREVRRLRITTASSHSENVTVKLNDVDYTIAVTNSGNIQRTVWELSLGTYAGWKAYPSDDYVYFVKDSVGVVSGTFSITGTSVQGTFSQVKAGAATSETFIPQADFNGDTLDGTGDSGITINTTKINIFQISFGYLGTDSIVFKMKAAPANGNNSTWIIFHTIKLPNSLTAPSFGNPSFPFTAAVYSAGSTTNLTVKVGSFAGFIEGKRVLHGNRFSYYGQSTGVSAASYLPLFTIMNKRYFGGRTNQSVINLISVTAALKHNSPTIIYIIKNGALTGNVDFNDYSTTSCSSWDTAATAVTFSDNNQLVWSGHLGDTGELIYNFDTDREELTIQPGEWYTFAAKATTGTPGYVTVGVNTREDQ